jgi:prepilin signal peptidase PulO-like enzyme (type II secretory pathway)
VVNFPNLSYADIILRFRQYTLMQQAVIAGIIVLLVYIPYSYFLLNLNVVESISMAIYSAILFIVVYYITSSIITKKSKQMAKQSVGPKKGQRNK